MDGTQVKEGDARDAGEADAAASPPGRPAGRAALSDKLTPEQEASLAFCREQIAALNGMISTLSTVYLTWGLPAEVILLALLKNMVAVIRREELRLRRKDLRVQVLERMASELALAELGRTGP
jgi:hypothetical protein